MQRLTAIVHGRVQGVGFRAYTQSTATRLNVHGWVKNQPDRTVKVVAEGADDSLSSLLDWLRRGPPSAHVDRVDAEWSPASDEFRGFQIRH